MEEKKQVNVRLSTAILIVIIVALIGGIVYFVYQNNVLKNKQTQSETELKDLQSRTQELQKTVDEVRNITTKSITKEENKQDSKSNKSTEEDNNEKQQYVGTYKNKLGARVKIELDETGNLFFIDEKEKYKINLNRKYDDGSIIICDGVDKNEPDWGMLNLYPAGTNLDVMVDSEKEEKTDNTKIRIAFSGSSGFADYESVFYKEN